MKILFVGNSHTYFNDMPATFAGLWETARGERPEVTMLAYSGRSLQWHETEYFALRFNLLYGRYDYCVIQQQAHPFPGEAETAGPLEFIISLCRSVGTVPLLTETWAECAAPEHQSVITAAHEALAKRLGITLVPVGSIWQSLLQEHPEIDLFWRDGEHASPRGDWLIAATLCAVLSGDPEFPLSPAAHDFIRDGGIDFDAPKVIESPADTPCTLTEAEVSAMAAAIARRLRTEP